MTHRSPLETPAPCACGKFTFRDFMLVPKRELTADHNWCPKCRREVLIVRRGARHLVTIPYKGRSVEAVEHALRQAVLAGVRLREGEIRNLVAVARDLAGLPPLNRPIRRGRPPRADIDAAVVDAATDHETLPVRALARRLGCSTSRVAARGDLFRNTRTALRNGPTPASGEAA